MVTTKFNIFVYLFVCLLYFSFSSSLLFLPVIERSGRDFCQRKRVIWYFWVSFTPNLRWSELPDSSKRQFSFELSVLWDVFGVKGEVFGKG